MSGNRPCVLLVEDDAVARAFLAEVLGALAVRLVVAGGTGEAVRAVADSVGRGVDLALLDLHLPDGDGGGLLQALRASGQVGRAVALTADGGAVLDGRMRAAGFDAVAHKPLSRAALVEVVERWVPAVRGGVASARHGSEVRDDVVAANGGSYSSCGAAGHAGGAAGHEGEGTCGPGGQGAAGFHGAPQTEGDAADGGYSSACEGAAGAGLALFDEDGALAAANGRADIVVSLRGLLVADLDGQCEAVRRALRGGDRVAARAVLHRMMAACGFCAAVRLQAAVGALDAVLARGGDHAREWQAFEVACMATRRDGSA